MLKDGKSFLHRTVTGNEKWIHYDNPKRRKSWGLPGHASTSTAKPNIHGKKLMLCIWDQLGVVYYELLNLSETFAETLYRTQLMRSNRALKEKRLQYYSRHDQIIPLDDNARPHVAVPVKNYSKILSTTPPTVFTRHCVIRLSSAPVNGTCSVRAAVHII
ncbi:Mariner Mos1 transposase [Eumeta japonica]|uniref:Mariner Mos1 transposase n=1 Tax=Eumeta variegata TaxID=151549 RepID=A0A4C1TVK9_EUMVA|nr:Mariner Mos1 transposase [Eumeta japonica]